MNDRVSTTITDHIADVRLTRADKMNAIDPAMFEGIGAAIDALHPRKDVRCVVLSGEGRAFCAGLDMTSMAGGGSGLSRDARSTPRPARELCSRRPGTVYRRSAPARHVTSHTVELASAAWVECAAAVECGILHSGPMRTFVQEIASFGALLSFGAAVVIIVNRFSAGSRLSHGRVTCRAVAFRGSGAPERRLAGRCESVIAAGGSSMSVAVAQA
eukprot:gene31324-35764_t